MKRLLLSLLVLCGAALMGGCVYDPAYGYVRSDGYYGGGYYGSAYYGGGGYYEGSYGDGWYSRPYVYDYGPSWYGSYGYSPGWYGPSIGIYYSNSHRGGHHSHRDYRGGSHRGHR
jgi:hypothetical protein